jgi:hypothetical protein
MNYRASTGMGCLSDRYVLTELCNKAVFSVGFILRDKLDSELKNGESNDVTKNEWLLYSVSLPEVPRSLVGRTLILASLRRTKIGFSKRAIQAALLTNMLLGADPVST